MFTSFDKAIAAFLAPVFMLLLVPFGITGEMTVEQAVVVGSTAIATAASVWLTRNKS